MNWKTPINIKCAVLIIIPLLQFVISPAMAEVKTFEKKYIYRVSELDNEASSKAVGRAQAEGLLYTELGNYLAEHTEAKLFLLGPKDIRSMVSALVRPETVSESQDGKSFTFTAKIATDPPALVKALDALRKDSQKSKDLAEIGREVAAALIKIEDLRKKLSSKGADASAEKQYRRAVDDMIAWNYASRDTGSSSRTMTGKQQRPSLRPLNFRRKKSSSTFAGRGSLRKQATTKKPRRI